MTRIDLDIRLKHADFTLEIDRRLTLSGVTAVFGPSGAGKSTLLRIIAGFERGAGRITFDDEVWEDRAVFVPPHRRRVATVFQEPRLFRHLDVHGNLAYAAKRAGQTDRLSAMIDRFGLAPLAHRRTETLSGGEAQRVALARALLTAPRLILMDEPLSALDQSRRQDILPYIEELRDGLRIPILYVSHSRAEVARLAGQMLTLAEGRVVGFGATAEMLGDPTRLPGIEGDEPGSLVSATVQAMSGDGLCTLSFSGGTILTPERMGPEGAAVRLFIRARDVMIAKERPDGLSALNILPATVEEIVPFKKTSADVVLRIGETRIRARITSRSVAALGLAPGVACHAILKSVDLARD